MSCRQPNQRSPRTLRAPSGGGGAGAGPAARPVPEEARRALVGLLITLASLVAAVIADAVPPEEPPLLLEGPRARVDFPPGKTVQLTCRAATADTQLWYEWYHNGELVANNDTEFTLGATEPGSLLIRTRAGSSQGYYQCVVRNAAGAAMSNTAYLRQAVFQKNQDESRRQVDNITVMEGSPVMLPCNHVNSVPKATFNWYTVSCLIGCYDNQLIEPDDRITMDENGSLVLTHVVASDSQGGRLYKCMANNPILRAKMGGSYARIIVLPNPYSQERVPSLLYLSQKPEEATVGGSVVMRCIFAGVPTAKVTWHRLKGDLPKSRITVSDNGRELLIRDLESSDAGDYQCIGHNQVGEGVPVIHRLNITAQPSSSQNLSMRVSWPEGSTSQLSCDANATAPVHRQWYYNAYPLNESEGTWWSVDESGVSLTLYNLSVHHIGVYSCNVSNPWGYLILTTHLSVHEVEPTTQPPSTTQTTTTTSHTTTAQPTTTSKLSTAVIETTELELTTNFTSNTTTQVDNTTNVVPDTTNSTTTNATQQPSSQTEALGNITATSESSLLYNTTNLQTEAEMSGGQIGSGSRTATLSGISLAAQVTLPLMFLLLLLAFLIYVYYRVRRKKTSYRVEDRERHYGINQEYDSDDSGYDEKEEKSVKMHLKGRQKHIEAELHL